MFALKKFPNSEENEGVVGLLIIFNDVWILIANNKRLAQKSFVLTSLFIVAISGIILFSGISINLYNNNNQAQAQQPK